MKILTKIRNLCEIASHPESIRLKMKEPALDLATFRLCLRLRNQGINPSVIFDVGANAGQFAVAATTIWPSARILSYEPQRKVFGLLETKAKDYHKRLLAGSIKPQQVADELMRDPRLVLHDQTNGSGYFTTQLPLGSGNANNGDLFVKKASACTIQNLAIAISHLMGVEGKIEIQEIGTRHGEKLFESLLGTEEKTRSIDRGEYFQVPLDARSLDYQVYFNRGQAEVENNEAYTSHNTKQLSVNEMISLIGELPEFQVYRREHLK